MSLVTSSEARSLDFGIDFFGVFFSLITASIISVSTKARFQMNSTNLFFGVQTFQPIDQVNGPNV